MDEAIRIRSVDMVTYATKAVDMVGGRTASDIAMRNILVHDYGDVNVQVLVSTVADDFPPLIADLERLLSETHP